MPLPPSTYMGLVLPAPGGDSGTWDDFLNTAVGGVVDGHRHIPGEGRQIPTAGINIDDDLQFNGFRATELDGAALTNLPTPLSTGATELFANSGDLWFRNAGGTNVRITLGNDINFTGFGGIGGDYAAVGALVAYVDSGDKYTFRQEEVLGTRHFAKNESADIVLHPFHAAGTGGDVVPATTIKANGSLASSYSLTLPTGLPANDAFVIVGSTGGVAFTNTVPGFTAVGDPTIQGELTVTQQLTVEGPGFIEGDLEVDGDIGHGPMRRIISAASGLIDPSQVNNWGIVPQLSGAGTAMWIPGATLAVNSIVMFPIDMTTLDQIATVSCFLQDTAGANTIAMRLYKSTGAGTQTQIGSTATSDGLGNLQTISIGSLTETIVANTYYTLFVYNTTGTATTHKIIGVEVVYDRPLP